MIIWVKCRISNCSELIADITEEGLCWAHHQKKLKAETEKQEVDRRKDEYGD